MTRLPASFLQSWHAFSTERRMRFWRITAIAVLVMSSLFLMTRGVLPQGDYIGRLSVEGIIMDHQKRNQSLTRLAEDDAMKALIVHVNSPGGSAVGGESLYQHLRHISERKPVVVVMHEVAASAGYMAALGGSHIFAREQTITGSIGAMFQIPNIEELLASLGINMELFKSGALKAVPNPYEPISPEARRYIMDAHIHASREFFLNLVMERRQLPENLRAELAQGQALSGRQALTLNLIDAIGGEMDAVTWLEDDNQLLKDLPIRNIRYKNRWSEFVKASQQQPFGAWLDAFDDDLWLLLFSPLLSLWSPAP